MPEPAPSERNQQIAGNLGKAEGTLKRKANCARSSLPVPVHNIIGKFNGTSDPKQRIFILTGHYDTLFKSGFIGANDGASSAAILLAFADVLAHQKTEMQIWLVWTDLEEAVRAFDGNDRLYGSKHLAQKLASTGIVPRIRGLLLLDMIGDKDLNVGRETGSSTALQKVIAQAIINSGTDSAFLNTMSVSLMITRHS